VIPAIRVTKRFGFWQPLQSPEPGDAAGGGGGASEGPQSGTEEGIESLSPDDDDEIPDTLEGIRQALKKERLNSRTSRKETNRLQAQLAELAAADPEAVKEAKKKAERLEREQEVKDREFRLRVQNLETKRAREVEALQTQLNDERTGRQRDQVRVAAERVYLNNKGLRQSSSDGSVSAFDGFWLEFGPRFAKDDEGLYVLDKDGDPELDPSSGKRLTPAAYMEKLRQDPLHGRHFEAEYGAGGGSMSGRDRRGPSSDFHNLNNTQKFKEAFKS
jgi:hypothetical protein